MKERAAKTLARYESSLISLSHRIHANPELGFAEERAAQWIAEALAAGGFAVTTGVCELPTAVSATAGSGPVHVALCAEYDALPGIGHACGHNIIAAAAVGAALALEPYLDDLGLELTVLGTPAEEGGGGKILMLERGAFDGVHAALMVHPAPFEEIQMGCLAVAHLDVSYAGRSAHASAFPELGRNAADALTVAQVGIGLLRQHLPASARVHGIIRSGGAAPNIVPEATTGEWLVRAETLDALSEVRPRVEACFQAGALATGCELDIRDRTKPYSHWRTHAGLNAAWRANVGPLGRMPPDPEAGGGRRTTGSTDMANVSLVIPSIHPLLGLDCYPAVNHQPEFTAVCASPVADRAVLDGALGLARTTIDIALAGGPDRLPIQAVS